jgi:hypothetical protein
MYKSLRTYVAAASLLLVTSCGGENFCYPGYQGGQPSSNQVVRTTVLLEGTLEEVAKRHGVTLDDLTSLNDLDSTQMISSFDTICLPKKK